jgi:hypothetical protein
MTEYTLPEPTWHGDLPAYSDKQMQAAYAAGLADAAPKWLPIESAPQDGTGIILRRRKRVGAAAWVSHKEYEGWTVGQDGDYWDDPTHWMQLPAAPEYKHE